MGTDRRSFIRQCGIAGTSLLLSSRTWAIPPTKTPGGRSLTFGIISDLHHLTFRVNEETRMKAFMDQVLEVNPDFIVQNGDFFQPSGAAAIMDQWNRFSGPKYHVLGNHDMDTCDKATIMGIWGMSKPYYSFDRGGYHFVVMDRNFLRQSDGTLVDYASSNWSPFGSPFRSFSDTAQLLWLQQDLASNKLPVIVFMHQPVFLSQWTTELGNADDILTIFDAANLTADLGSNGKVCAVFMGHDHDDRYGERVGVHYFLLNSASYAYNGDAYYYKEALFAFVTLDPAGHMSIAGRTSVYRDSAPDKVKAAFPAKISDHRLNLI